MPSQKKKREKKEKHLQELQLALDKRSLAQKRIDEWISYDDISLTLNIYSIGLKILPNLPDNLLYLNCELNYISRLPCLPPNLKRLNCYNNRLTRLPKIPDTLIYLDCSNNLLTRLPKVPNTLFYLNCCKNKFLWNFSRVYSTFDDNMRNNWWSDKTKLSWNNYKILNKLRRRFNKQKRRRCYLVIKDVVTNDLSSIVVKYL